MSESRPVDEVFAAAIALHSAGDLPAAEAAYRELLRDVPTYAPALSNLGSLLAKTGREEEAASQYHLALAADPRFADAHYNLGNLLRRAGKPAEAAEQFRACVLINPAHPHAAFNFGLMAVALGQLHEAEPAFRAACALETAPGEARLRLGDVLVKLGRPAEGVAEFRAYADAHPTDPRGLYNLALALSNDDRPADAADLLHRALKLKPDYAEAHNALGLALELLGRKDDAAHHYQQAVRAKPDLADAWSNLGLNLSDQGRCEEAVAALRSSLSHRPDAPAVHSNLLLQLNYSSAHTREQVRDEHAAWGERFTTPVQPRPEPRPPHDPHRRLRIGYVSADFRAHPVAGFLETLLAHHDRQQFEVFAYPSVRRPDGTTERLKGLADHWRPITGLTDSAAADLIHADGIDVLVDVGGHHAGNRLIVFAHRPAAVQVALFGYPNTTGIPAMDLRVTDPLSDPAGATDHLYTERCLRLPEVPWVYRPPADAPPVSPLPALTRRPFTFGCLNNSAKISDACLDAWAKLIQSTPGSRLVLMGGQSAAGLKRLTDKFVKAGIFRERVQVIQRLPPQKYLEQYHEFDLALDPFPYNGQVTTCDALWMGVPVLTVAGASYLSRQGVMLTYALGLNQFAIGSAAELIDAARWWMGHRQELADIRAGLRERLAASPVCDGGRYVRHLEAALHDEWAKTLTPPTGGG